MVIKFHLKIRLLLIHLAVLLTSVSAVATPVINSVQGTVANNATVTINGSGFTQKPTAAPLFWWRADLGTSPSNLGRKTAWDKSYFHGTPSTSQVAPGSSQSMAWDHGRSSGAALSAVRFNSNRLYLHRKLYEDFDVTTDYAIRTRVTTTSGNVAVGDLITGQTSGATGRVVQIVGPDSQGRLSLFYDQNTGSINASPKTDFVFNEVMTGPTGTFRNAEGSSAYPTGTFRTFNDKTIRFWNEQDKNNIYIGPQGVHGSHYNIIPEYTDNTLGNKYFDNPMKQVPFKWITEEVVYEASGVDAKNGIWKFYKDGMLASSKTFITRDSARPGMYDIVYQSQVSNGAQLDSIAYYDSVYIDDSWHHVVLCSSSSWSNCNDKEIQIPVNWSDNQITIQVNLGGMDLAKPTYVYVVDANGNANNQGHPLCPKCPLPPSPS